MCNGIFEEKGIDPGMVKQFLQDHIEIGTRMNDDLIHGSCEITHHRNKVIIAQVKLMLFYMEMDE